MTRFKDFGTPETPKEKLSFALHGETFNCIPAIQGKVLLDLAKSASANDEADSVSVIADFFPKVLEDESLERFNALVVDKHKIVTVETLGTIIGWLVEEYSKRPEGQPEAS